MAMTDETLTKRLHAGARELGRIDARIDRARATVENYDVDARALADRRDKAQTLVDEADKVRAEALAGFEYLATLARARGIEVPDPNAAEVPAVGTTPTPAEDEEADGYVPPAGA